MGRRNWVAAALASALAATATGPAHGRSLVVVVDGGSPRGGAPVRLELPRDRVGPKVVESLGGRPGAVKVVEVGGDVPITGQLDVVSGALMLTFVLPAGAAEGPRRFRLDPTTATRDKGPWSVSDENGKPVDLRHGDKTVFRYNRAPVSNPNHPKIPARAAYIHPAFTPKGALITGDFSAAHPHHRGFFLAYTKTTVGGAHPDFWNIQNGTGLIHFEGLDAATAGPVTARIVTRHRWEAKGPGAVLRETWDVEAYDVPGAPYWMFDLTSTQQAVGAPLELPPYRYGGMAYRGPDPFLKGPLDVLTSEGLDRVKGDQKPARWVDLTGPVADGSSEYGGALVMDHPSNPHHPTPARIHPTTLPFFAFTPSHDAALTIRADAPTVFRYRVVIHDGRPDAALDARLWRDFASPPKARLEPAAE